MSRHCVPARLLVLDSTPCTGPVFAQSGRVRAHRFDYQVNDRARRWPMRGCCSMSRSSDCRGPDPWEGRCLAADVGTTLTSGRPDSPGPDVVRESRRACAGAKLSRWAACIRDCNERQGAQAGYDQLARFADPAGLSCDNVASAEDLAKLVAAASENPVIREYSTDRGYSVCGRTADAEYRNTNALVSNPTWNIIVQKTGFINDGSPLPGDAGRHSRPHRRDRAPELSVGKNTWVADAAADPQVDGSQAAHA